MWPSALSSHLIEETIVLNYILLVALVLNIVSNVLSIISNRKRGGD